MVGVQTRVASCEIEHERAESATLRRLSAALPESAVRAAARIIFQDTSDKDLEFFQEHASSLCMGPIGELIAIETQRRATLGRW